MSALRPSRWRRPGRPSGRRGGPRCTSWSGGIPALDRARVEFVVLSEGERGLLGVGYEPARVLAALTEVPAEGAATAVPSAMTAAATPSSGDSDAAAAVREMLDRVLTGLELDADMDVQEPTARSWRPRAAPSLAC